jgi:hypothetical protein
MSVTVASKRPKLNKNKRIKAIARERVGEPKATFAIPEKAKRPKPKHKKPVTADDEDR